MKKSALQNVFRSGLLILAMLCGTLFSVAAQSSIGDVFLDPPNQTVSVNNGFTVNVKVNSGTQKVAAYGIDISFTSSIIQVNTAVGSSGVEAGADGFVSAVNPNSPTGPLAITGFDVSGKGPGTALNFLKVNFTAVAKGTSVLGVTVKSLNNTSYANIGTPKGINGSVTVSDVLLGDVNGSKTVDIIDALMVAQNFVGLPVPGFIAAAGDVNCDGIVNIVDALIIAQYYVGLVSSLPVGNCGGPITTPTPIVVTPTPTSTYNGNRTPAPRYDNPFTVSKWFVDPVWSQKAIDGGGASIANYNTALWMDRIGAITDGIGLRGHLNAALDQGAEMIMVVVYDLPNRDCAAAASNGELQIANNGFNRYMTEYIDPIAAILSDAKYAPLNIVCIIEVDSLPNLVTNLDLPECAEANGPGGYVDGIRYALNKLSVIPNVYNYLDIGHSGWLGWDSNLGPCATLITNCIKGTTKGVNSVNGFVSNTANYTPTEEIYLPNADLQINYQAIKSAKFYEWNPVFDETDYTRLMYNQFVSKGFPSSIGMLIDTSRNGWGGPNRPSGVSTSTNIDTYVDQSRLDRRYHRGNWCNQAGAGIGERPMANPGPSHLDAYVWIKPPGESDGISDPNFTPDPNDPAKQFDKMCDPNGTNSYCNCGTTGATVAPHAGRWNQPHFNTLLANAWPPL